MMSYGHLYVTAAILDAILNLSNCSSVTCYQAVYENRDPWLPKSTVKNNARLRGKNGSWLPDYNALVS